MSLKHRIFTAAAILLTGIGGCIQHEKNKAVVPEKIQYVVDVRSQQEFDGRHLEGAILIPHTEIGSKIRSAVPESQSAIALYCRSGRRAGQAKETMAQLGYKNVVNLGGLEDAAKALNRKIVASEKSK